MSANTRATTIVPSRSTASDWMVVLLPGCSAEGRVRGAFGARTTRILPVLGVSSTSVVSKPSHTLPAWSSTTWLKVVVMKPFIGYAVRCPVLADQWNSVVARVVVPTTQTPRPEGSAAMPQSSW